MIAAASFSSILDILLFSTNFYVPLICPPMFFGISGRRISVTSCLVGVLTGCGFTAYWLAFVNDPSVVGGIIPGLILSLVATYVSDKIERLFLHKTVKWYAEQEHQEADAH